jgi:hypothetical protein
VVRAIALAPGRVDGVELQQGLGERDGVHGLDYCKAVAMKATAFTLFFFSALAFAQGPDGKDAKPSDGAIQGGSIRPGETSGAPDSRPTPAPSPRGAERCRELSGTLREQCQEQEQKSSSGATRAPGEPPPQEPRQEKQ